MKVDFRQIEPEGSEFSFSESAEDLDLTAKGIEFPEAIEVELAVSKTGDEIVIQGRLSTVVGMDCSRCLEHFETPMNTKIQFVIQLLEMSAPQDSDDEDFVILSKTTQEYDLSERVRQMVVLELPLKPLCSESCLGLCPMCGINLNETDCDCTPDKTDERWESLRQLFDE